MGTSDSHQLEEDVDDLADQIANQLNFSKKSSKTSKNDKDDNKEQQKQHKSLSSSVVEKEEEEIPVGLKKVANWISSKVGVGGSSNKRRILVLSGAGVSVAAGIPDFRTPGTGLYDNLQKYNLPYPEAVFDVNFYQNNPEPFCNLAKEIWPGLTHSPTLTHSFLALLSKKGLLLRNYTQNIDGLEYIAGMSSDDIVECHGHFRTASCVSCGRPMDGDVVKETIVIHGQTPTCTDCGQNVKPDIVFFGESLPDRFHRLLQGDVSKADLLLVMGTSLKVAPVSLIPDMVKASSKKCTRALFNNDLVMNLKGKDVFIEGDCDTNIQHLCRLLGWEEELLEQNASTRITSTNNNNKQKGNNNNKKNDNKRKNQKNAK